MSKNVSFLNKEQLNHLTHNNNKPKRKTGFDKRFVFVLP